MSHTHKHSHDRSGYYLEQLCTVGACGALAVVCILSWWEKRLDVILAPQFFLWVLGGGIALFALALIRGSALWTEAGRDAAAHQHEHGEECDHDHGHAHCEHHHEHAWTPAKYAVLLLPVILYLIGLPNAGFSADFYRKDKSMTAELETPDGEVQSKGDRVALLGFRELKDAAYVPAKREAFEGLTVQLKGMFMRGNSERTFTLFRVRVYCCQADSVPLPVRIISPTNITRYADSDWVEVKGVVQFRKVAGMDKYIPVLMLKTADDVQKTEPATSDADL